MEGLLVTEEELNKPIPSFRCPKCRETFDLRECTNRYAVFMCACGKMWKLSPEDVWVTED